MSNFTIKIDSFVHISKRLTNLRFSVSNLLAHSKNTKLQVKNIFQNTSARYCHVKFHNGIWKTTSLAKNQESSEINLVSQSIKIQTLIPASFRTIPYGYRTSIGNSIKTGPSLRKINIISSIQKITVWKFSDAIYFIVAPKPNLPS